MTYKIQIDDTVRNASKDEASNIESQQKAAADQRAAFEAKQAIAESARTKLAKLGLTEAEVAALLGA